VDNVPQRPRQTSAGIRRHARTAVTNRPVIHKTTNTVATVGDLDQEHTVRTTRQTDVTITILYIHPPEEGEGEGEGGGMITRLTQRSVSLAHHLVT